MKLREPVGAALWRLVVGAEGLPRTESPKSFVPWRRVNPRHRRAVDIARGEPFGFCLLVVEEARTQVLDDFSCDHVYWSSAALEFVERLQDQDSRLAEIRMRALLYLSDALRIACRDHDREEAMRKALDMVGEPDRQPETQALVLELEACVASELFANDHALNLLTKAEKLLPCPDFFDLRAEVFITKGVVLADMGRFLEAGVMLARGRSAVRVGDHPQLYLRASHNLAINKLSQGLYLDPLDDFLEFRELYDEVGDKYMQAQRHWYLGKIYLHTAHYAEAEKSLYAAHDAYCDLRQGFETVEILIDLGKVYVQTLNHIDLAILVSRMRRNLDGRSLRSLVLPGLMELRDLACRRGFVPMEVQYWIEHLNPISRWPGPFN